MNHLVYADLGTRHNGLKGEAVMPGYGQGFINHDAFRNRRYCRLHTVRQRLDATLKT